MGFITVFGGTFNPIHIGHQEIIKCLCDHKDVDKVLLMPTKIPPHKSTDYLASESDRYNMCNLIAADFDNVEVSDIELFREGKSYTIDTINTLCSLYPNKKLALTIGGDMLVSFTKWKQFQDILSKCTLIVFSRGDIGETEHKNAISHLKDFGANIIVIDTDITNISSTEIRNSLKTDIKSAFLDEKVRKYIIDNNLYGV